MVGIKKSNFIANGTTPIDGSSTFDFVKNGQNVRISFDNFLAQLGTTGALQQEGPGTATPVLDDQGTIKGIRNLEDGSGVTASVSGQNGITLDHNFTANAVGVPILQSETLASPIIASLIAGANTTIVNSSGAITISTTAAASNDIEVQIADLSDLPAPSGTVISIGSASASGFTNLRFQGSVDISPNTLAIVGLCQISGNNAAVDIVTSNSTNPLMAVGSSALFKNRLGVTSPNADMFSASAGCVIVGNQCFLQGKGVGLLTDILVYIQDFSRYVTTFDGIRLSGDSNNEIIHTTCNLVGVKGSFIDFGTAKVRNVDVLACAWVQNSNEIFTGLGDANIIPGGRISLQNTRSVVLDGEETITGISNANPAVVSVSGSTSRVNGDIVTVRSVSGMTEINTSPGAPVYKIANSTGPAGNTYELTNIDSTSFGTYASGGISEVAPRILMTGFSPSMSRGEFTDNTGLRDSENAANALFDSTATTTITSDNVPENMNGVFSSTLSERVSVDSDGVMTNNSRETISFEYKVNATIEKTTGGADLIQVGVGLKRNGPDSFDSDFVFQGGGVAKGSQSAAPTSVSCTLTGQIDPGGQLRPMLVNTSTSGDIDTRDCYCSFSGR
jgi:hypothetical protein